MKMRIAVTIDSDILKNLKLANRPVSNIVNQALIDSGYKSNRFIKKLIVDKETELSNLREKEAKVTKLRTILDARELLELKLETQFNKEKQTKASIVWTYWLRSKIEELRDKYGSDFNDKYGVDYSG